MTTLRDRIEHAVCNSGDNPAEAADAILSLLRDEAPPSDEELIQLLARKDRSHWATDDRYRGVRRVWDSGYTHGFVARSTKAEAERAELQRRLEEATKKLVSARGRRNDQYVECALLRGGNPTPSLPSTAKLREIAHHMCDEADLPSHYRNCFEAGRDSRAGEIRELIAEEHSACERANSLAVRAESAERERDAARDELREVKADSMRGAVEALRAEHERRRPPLGAEEEALSTWICGSMKSAAEYLERQAARKAGGK